MARPHLDFYRERRRGRRSSQQSHQGRYCIAEKKRGLFHWQVQTSSEMNLLVLGCPISFVKISVFFVLSLFFNELSQQYM